MVRTSRLSGVVAVLCLTGFAVQVGTTDLARGASEQAARAVPAVAQPYHRGPLAARDSMAIPEQPRGAKELLSLSVLAAILYGFRASGLARDSERSGRLGGR